jgi:hypothetical protein
MAVSKKSNRETSSSGSGDYAVGYGKPPRHTRFQAGKSGNPKGRPKASLDHMQLLTDALNETVMAKTPDGRTVRMTKLKAAMTQMVNKAAQGDDRALARLLATLPAIEAQRAESAVNLEDARAKLLALLLRQRETVLERNAKAAVENGENTNEA